MYIRTQRALAVGVSVEYKMTIEEIRKKEREIMWIQGKINSLKAKLPKELRDIK